MSMSVNDIFGLEKHRKQSIDEKVQRYNTIQYNTNINNFVTRTILLWPSVLMAESEARGESPVAHVMAAIGFNPFSRPVAAKGFVAFRSDADVGCISRRKTDYSGLYYATFILRAILRLVICQQISCRFIWR